MNQDEVPRIRQVVFLIDKNRHYKFDVNSNISMRGLKKMICFAANLNKNGLRIFSERRELTIFDEETLIELFPDKQLVEFTISIEEHFPADLNESRIKLKLGDTCPEHQGKYLYYFCYDCSRSICSICLHTAHKDHNMLEKYDYLQDSKHLIDLLFKDVHFFVSDIKLDKKIDAEELKKRIKTVYFPELAHILKVIEEKQIDIIDQFIKVSESSYSNMKDNVSLLKEHCTVGLDKLKEEIHIENIMMNEEVFLIFDKKYREITLEEKRLEKEKKKYDVLVENFDNISKNVLEVHNRLYEFLQAESQLGIYINMRNSIVGSSIEPIHRDEIIEKMLLDVKRPMSGRKSMSVMLQKSPVDTREKKSDQKINFNAVSSIFSLNNNNFNNIAKEDFPSTHTESSTLALPSVRNPKAQPLSEPIELKEKSGKKDISTPKKSVSQPKNPNLKDIFMRCNTGTKNVLVFDDSTGDISTIPVTFPKLSNVTDFLPHCTWVNIPGSGKLYICGGQAGPETGSNSFFCYNYLDDSIIRLADMNIPRYSHSMFYHNECIYVVGGYKNNTTEKFDLTTMRWLKLANCNFEERQNPILCVYNNYLYAFFGYTTGSYSNTVEKLKISNPKARWEVVPYKNSHQINLKLIGCGTVLGSDGKLYFFGGRGQKEQRKTAFDYEFATSSFANTTIEMSEYSYFPETALYQLSGDCYGQFDNEDGSHFLKIQIG